MVPDGPDASPLVTPAPTGSVAALVDGPSLRTLVYRYFFFAWLFRDAGRGNLFERAAALRHNVEQSRWLPTYMRRYVVTGLLFTALGMLIEPLAPVLSAAFFVPGAITVPMTTVALLGYVGLRSWV